jgi:uncharacterized membrane protein (DUF485 family)
MSEDYITRLGIIMFAIYFALYITFILVAVLSPQTMATDIGSLNLAIVFGFGLIVFAIIQALLYNLMCSRREKKDAKSRQRGE